MDQRLTDTRILLYLLIAELVDHPDDVNIQMCSGAFATLFEIYLNAKDLRHIIGKKGRTITAIREIFNKVASLGGDNQRYILDIIEPDKQDNKKRPKFPDYLLDLNAEEDHERLGEMLRRLVSAIVLDTDSVRVESIDGGRNIVLEIHVAQDDLRRVIGQKGSTVMALRILLSNIAHQQDNRVHVLVSD